MILPDYMGRLLENHETGGSRELFLPENNLQTSSAVDFSKKHSNFGGLETNQRELFLLENDSQDSSAVNFPKKYPDFGGLETNWKT